MAKKIYIILNESRDRFKIGFSKNPSSRLKTLQTGNDDIISLCYERSIEYYSKVETALKKDYKKYQTQGEWFEYSINIGEFDKRVTFYENMFESLKDNPFT